MSQPVAIIVIRILSCNSSLMTVPKIIFALESINLWIVSAAFCTSDCVRSEPPEILIITPLALPILDLRSGASPLR